MRFIPSVTCDHCTVTSVGPIRVHRDDCPHSAVRTALTAAQAEAERVKAPVMCSVCCGQPLKSGRECICGGTGTEQAEMHGLRVECFRLEDENATLRAQLAAAEARVTAARAEGVAAERERCLGILEMRDKDAVVRFCARLIREGAET